MKIVLLNPEIPYNTGNIARSCVLTNTELHLIKPLGFDISDKAVKRAGLDYWKLVKLYIWESYEDFIKSNKDVKIYYATTKTKNKYSDVKYEKDDFIMFGPESRGIPESILKANSSNCVTIPMIDMGRSLNLSNSAAIMLYETYRQIDFNFGGYKMNKYITTPIYYPNAKAHIGTAYTTVLCDILARYYRLYGYNVNFMTGLDEHGQKIQESSEKNNMTPQEWVDRMNEDFVKLWKLLKISNTTYVRTTNQNHIDTVEKVIQKVYENGDIYKGEYKGKYCVSEETFVTESQLIDGKYMGKEVIEVSEPTYFFRLSKYADKLLEYYENHPYFIIPSYRKNEVISFINKGLQDLSISRTTFNWGIPLKLNNKHIIYVWFDALNSYLTGSYYFNDEKIYGINLKYFNF